MTAVCTESLLDTLTTPLALFSGAAAAAPRTLNDVLADTAARHPAASAIDDGTTVLTYTGLLAAVDELRQKLTAEGIGAGDRVGIRVPSGTADLYVAILAVLAAGAAYVPVDFEDPDERADLVFTEAAVCAVLGEGRELVVLDTPAGRGQAGLGDDAWIIFTSGSTGRPKGVAVSHRAAAAFVDAEADLFLATDSVGPIGPDDRVLAGLSVAFDASCEEMWLAWRNGACLVPAPRWLVRTGVDLGPWLVEQEITVVSTVPTLVALWPAEALLDVRLLILGGEACPPDLAARLAQDGREVWNTYGPTEATVVACGARMTGEGPVRIGLPLAGWELAVVDQAGEVVPMGGTGELVIGGVGLARYLDPAKDAEKYAPLPSLGWTRAYRSGDLVRAEPEGLLFLGRADEQVKLGGRRIELGEIDAALQALPGVSGAAAAVRTTASGTQLLVGYVVVAPDFDADSALTRLREAMPAALVPRLAVVGTLPTRTSGKVDRNALPWPLDLGEVAAGELHGTQAWLGERWAEVLGAPPAGPGADFFASGGGSLAAARLVSLVRADHPSVSVSDVYHRPTVAALAARLDELAGPQASTREIAPVPRRAAVIQTLAMLPLLTIVGLRWTVVLAALGNLLGYPFTTSWWLVGAGWLLLFSPPGRLAIAAGGARMLLRGVKPGTYPRGGGVHLRLWAAEQLAERSGATDLAGSWLTHYARALGARVADGADLHSLPPVTGMLKVCRGAAIEPEVDLSGTWVDGDLVHIGKIRVGADATVGARSTLFPGARIGKRAEIAPGSGVVGSVPTGQRWSGVPAAKQGKAAHRWPKARPARPRTWLAVYDVTSVLLGLLPVVSALPALWVFTLFLGGTPTLGAALAAVPAVTVTWLVTHALLTLVSVRLLGIGLHEGHHPVRGRVAWQAWTTLRLMDSARSLLFPLYASLFTPVWLRALGMRVGRHVEASTVVALPAMTTVGDGAFLADDTMVASYELGGGWLRIAAVRVGKRAFVGNSGMAAPGRSVPKRGLVGVLSAAPKRAKAGSSYLGMPPMKLPRVAERGDAGRTYEPPRRLLVARALVELCRVVPMMCSVALAVLVFAAIGEVGFPLGLLVSGVLLIGGGLAACAVAVAAKWLLVGRFRARNHPLWSSFVWRNELADTFVEVLAVPWLVGSVGGTPLMSWWLRALGARVGRGVWCDSYWLPEADLVHLGDGATVNRGCVVQTHLFHDRILRMDQVTLAAGATLGPHGIVLPGTTVGAHTCVGPASLVMAGEQMPAGTRWLGNPVAAWR
ncbi:Pls/PosA family non-ribosomal peptide synthetase [Actinophytocola algeriensis]|uniref:Non-ribosomal peptide synthetase-like protein n=1 Tax=Actinophytocola algeriensis TaxID=1768010 RepID=A0A7W7VH75_9PSEU|nr:Pls/PosA family non-ribosomal peptide synthetase [Actinophytocola algeriensis]MBB4909914.1 non-ribosomal peptide synthetase-like protein [Actinophytocola algeriensis]MBE1475904.1 non-ribosomal peptide synthetase-like protein [Actinophytocola algeriensis]